MKAIYGGFCINVYRHPEEPECIMYSVISEADYSVMAEGGEEPHVMQTIWEVYRNCRDMVDEHLGRSNER